MLTPRADQYNIADIRSAADIVEEFSDKITYLGFCSPGTTEVDQPNWSILKIEQFGTVQPFTTHFKWATGLCSFNLKFSERLILPYSFKKF
jgi:hypothetical protein